MFYDIFVELCAKKGVKPTRAALDMGLSKATPTLWKNKGYTPRGDIINKVAAYFGVSVDYLLETKKKKSPQPIKAVSDEELKFALFGDATVSDEDFEDVKRFAEFIKNKKKE